NLVRGALILLIPVVENVPGTAHHVLPLFVITFLFSAAGQVFAPAEAASIPSLVHRDQIMDATSLFMSTVIITLVLGVPAATLCIRLFGTQAPFYIAAGLFGAAALGVWRVGTSLRAVPKGSAPSQEVWRELREGLVILGASPPLRLALGELTVALVVVFTVFALGPPYMATVLNRAPEDTYILLIPATVGMVGTAAALGQVVRRLSRARTMVVAFAGAGLALIVLGVVPRLLHSLGADAASIAMAIVPATLFGCGLGAVLIPAFTVLQERTTEESRGRIFGGIFTVINAAVAIPLLLAGTLADAFGVGAVVTGLGTVLLALALLARSRFWKQVAILDEDGGGPADEGPGDGGELAAAHRP
ncbi:MAG: MFS transporter, partial [Candidatus Dormibacteria bacterium]